LNVNRQAFGWCPNGSQCPSSHDTDLIILQDEQLRQDKKSRKKRKRDKRKGGGAAAGGAAAAGAGGGEEAGGGGEEEEVEGERESKISHMELDAADKPAQEHTGNGNGIADETTPVATAAAATTTDGKETAAVAGGDHNGESAKAASASAEDEASRKRLEGGTHRAGFDAFMTAYIFAHACTLEAKEQQEEKKKKEGEQQQWLPACHNKVYLSGKAAPLHIVKSVFSKSSKAHGQKMALVWGKQTLPVPGAAAPPSSSQETPLAESV